MSGSAIVIGAGPAGLAIAAALAERDVDVCVIDPNPERGWESRYGMWLDEVHALGLDDVVDQSWARALICSDRGTRHAGAAYALLDNEALREHLLTRLEKAGGRLAQGVAQRLEEGPPHTVHTDRGPLTADVVVDAAGFSGAVLEPRPRPQAWQSAYGLMIEVDEHPWAADEMILMDFSTPGELNRQRPPTFLYAMPHDAHHIFVEETVLTSDSTPSFDALRERLIHRLEELGVRIRLVLSEERVRIPMGGALARGNQTAVAFGAASGLIHPATGYTVATSLRLAPEVAEAIAGPLNQGDALGASRAGWSAVLPAKRRRAHMIAQVGHRVLLELDQVELGSFLMRFFAQPRGRWMAYMSGTSNVFSRFGAMAGMAPGMPVSLYRPVLSGFFDGLFQSLYPAAAMTRLPDRS
jgi:capsanthin/capsorubin synthase